MSIYFRNPDLLLAGKVDLYYRNLDGVAYPKHVLIADQDGAPSTAEDLDQRDGLAAKDRKRYENDAKICERFSHLHDAVRLPNFEAASHPFHEVYLYRRLGEDST